MRVISHRHTAIIVENLDLMSQFFVALGFRETRRDFEKGEFISHLVALENVVLESAKLALADGYVIELIKYISHPTFTKPQSPSAAERQYYYGYDHISLTVDNIEDAIQRVLSLGGSLISTPKRTNPGLPSIHSYVTDPEGNIIHLAQNE